MSLGQDRVRVSFNTSGDPVVDEIKKLTADLIDLCNDARDVAGPEEARHWSLAMTDYENAAMWAVKAATSRTAVEETKAA